MGAEAEEPHRHREILDQRVLFKQAGDPLRYGAHLHRYVNGDAKNASRGRPDLLLYKRHAGFGQYPAESSRPIAEREVTRARPSDPGDWDFLAGCGASDRRGD